MSAGRSGSRGLGVDPLDSLTGGTPPPAPVTRTPVKTPTLPVKLDTALVERGRAAVWWLMHHGQPTATLKGLVERALEAELRRLADEHNDGQAFPPVEALPRGGRIHPG